MDQNLLQCIYSCSFVTCQYCVEKQLYVLDYTLFIAQTAHIILIFFTFFLFIFYIYYNFGSIYKSVLDWNNINDTQFPFPSISVMILIRIDMFCYTHTHSCISISLVGQKCPTIIIALEGISSRRMRKSGTPNSI